MYDAIHDAVEHESPNIKTDKPFLVYVTIITDGGENSSKRNNETTVRDMIRDRLSKNTWVFMFMGPPSSRTFAQRIAISNVIEFNPNPAEMTSILEKERHSRSKVFDEVNKFAETRGLVLSKDDFQKTLAQLANRTIQEVINPNSHPIPPPSSAAEIPVNWAAVDKLDRIHKPPFIPQSYSLHIHCYSICE